MRHRVIVLVVCGISWLGLAAAARAQTTSPFAARQQRQYYASYPAPAVSPYVNLGTSASGVSNYQTLVRPMIEDRAAIEQQSAAIDELNQRLRGGRAARSQQTAPASGAAPRTSVRFMDYSRYFGTTW